MNTVPEILATCTQFLLYYTHRKYGIFDTFNELILLHYEVHLYSDFNSAFQNLCSCFPFQDNRLRSIICPLASSAFVSVSVFPSFPELGLLKVGVSSLTESLISFLGDYHVPSGLLLIP